MRDPSFTRGLAITCRPYDRCGTRGTIFSLVLGSWREGKEDCSLNTVIFLGPTLPVSVARQYLDAKFLPPVEQGDILRVLKDRPDAIGIIDGYFQRVPSVWHKEILTALEEGVYVAGAASMGALRAAELADFGMAGIGAIFAKFHSGEYTDDDEVAVTHAAADLGYRALSEAMVNIRECCEIAAQAGVIGSDDAQRVVKIAKALHFSERHWETILGNAIAEGMDARAAQELRSFRDQMSCGAKERDAVALLKHLATLDRQSGEAQSWERPKIRLRVERTAFLADLKQQVKREAIPEPAEVPGTALNVARKKVLLGKLAQREAVRRGLLIGHDDVREMTDWFRGTYSLEDDDHFLGWKAHHALPETEFAFAMHRFTEVVRVEEACRPEIDAELDTYLKVYSAADENRCKAPVWVQLNVGLGRGAEGAQASARILFDELIPILRRLSRRKVVDRFHFVRKAPDLRLRFRAVGPHECLLLQLGKMSQVLYERGAVVSAVRSVYEPEARVFGGSDAMDAVHDYFDADSRGWIRWNQNPLAEQIFTAEQLCTAVINELFHSVLGCPNEVWDAWNNLSQLTREAKGPAAKLAGRVPVNGRETLAAIRGADPMTAAVAKHYTKANQAFSAAIHRVRERGLLEVGIRSLLANMAMFHCNRFGLDGAKQFSIAESAGNAWHPYGALTPAGRRLRSATSGRDHARASRSAGNRVLD
jgi:thiopeptide-type bacteriocin biosynthesis protein